MWRQLKLYFGHLTVCLGPHLLKFAALLGPVRRVFGRAHRLYLFSRYFYDFAACVRVVEEVKFFFHLVSTFSKPLHVFLDILIKHLLWLFVADVEVHPIMNVGRLQLS